MRSQTREVMLPFAPSYKLREAKISLILRAGCYQYYHWDGRGESDRDGRTAAGAVALLGAWGTCSEPLLL